MILPGLPEGVDLLGYRPVAEGEFAWVMGAALPGPIGRNMFVVAALEGFAFQYDVTNDTYRVISTKEVIPSAAPAAKPISFGDALDALKAGKKAAREGWENKWLEWNERMLPHLCMMPGQTVWEFNKPDMAARDWKIAE